MKRTSKSLVSLYLSAKILPHTNPTVSTIKHFPLVRPLSTKSTKNSIVKDEVYTKSKKDTFILEKFRERKLQGSLKTTTQPPETTKSSSDEEENENDRRIGGSGSATEENERGSGGGATKEVSSFEELGLKEEVAMAAGEMNVWVPSEIQCVGIPAILERKSVVLSSDSGSGGTLAYVFPLVQLLIQDENLSSMKPNHPRAVVLCRTEELSDEVFRTAKLISDFSRLKLATKESGSEQSRIEELLNAPIGMLIGTPSEVLQQMEGSIVTDDIKYLVLDQADAMFDHGFGPEISKIIKLLKNHTLIPNWQGLQIVLVTSTMSKILGKNEMMKRIERDNAGQVAAIMLEMDQMEAFEISESLDALKKKMAEALDFFASGP